MDNKTKLLLCFDLYWLRFKKPGQQWYELTDYLRDCLRKDGLDISYTKDDVIVNGLSMKSTVKEVDNAKRTPRKIIETSP